MNHRCLYCYEPIEDEQDFHEKCSMEFFGTPSPPEIEYSLDQMDELAKRKKFLKSNSILLDMQISNDLFAQVSSLCVAALLVIELSCGDSLLCTA